MYFPILLIALLSSISVNTFQNTTEPTWFAYIEKTLSLCYKKIFLDTKDLSAYTFRTLSCFSDTWKQCLNQQLFTEPDDRIPILFFPCLHGNYILGAADVKYKIEVHALLQVNLTFTQFSLP